ncbi:MAG: HPr family phosphocarrier protein [Nanoarchaeota archaeon]|nr:HPr family phosphocarrier protein [Nanoarchaeota archaeon]MBU1005552.1 HPr family phosphocarrier protein [Nanoarchaeota archaeon]MBU1945328.1 HPr family phosphocarrier protein [Nanoarchaeota archaeon]
MQTYFGQRLKEEGIELEARLDSLTKLAVETRARELYGTIRRLRVMSSGTEVARHEEDHQEAIDKGIGFIVASVLSRYHAHSEIEINNNDVTRLKGMIEHYQDIDFRMHYRGKLYHLNQVDLSEIQLKKGEYAAIYAHDIQGDETRAKNAVDNLVRFLGNEISKEDEYAHYLHKPEIEVNIGDGTGVIHLCPATLLVTAAQKYKGNVMIRYGSETFDAKSILSILMHAIRNGHKLTFLYEPNKGSDSEEVHRSIISVLNT